MIEWVAESCRARAIRVAFLGRGEPPFTLELALGIARALLEIRSVLATLAHLVADDPR